MPGQQHGVTLIELMFCLVLGMSLVGWGAPSFRALGLDAARAREVNLFVQAVYLARNEAVKRNGVVSLCSSADGATCATTANWRLGWIVFVNRDGDSPAVRDSGEELLHAYPTWDRGTIVANRPTFSFRAFGQSGATGTVTFCDERGSSDARAIVISQTGRPRISDRNASGSAIAC